MERVEANARCYSVLNRVRSWLLGMRWHRPLGEEEGGSVGEALERDDWEHASGWTTRLIERGLHEVGKLTHSTSRSVRKHTGPWLVEQMQLSIRCSKRGYVDKQQEATPTTTQ